MSTPIWTVRGSAYACSGQGRAERPPGDRDDLEGAHDPPTVVGKDPRGRLGIGLGKAAVELRRPDGGQLGLEPAPYVGLGPGELEPVQHRPRVERRAADQHGRPAAAAHLGDRLPRPALELRHGQRLGDVEQVEQVMRVRRAARPAGGLAVPMSMPAVDRHRVGVDDLAAEPLREVEREAGLARRGRADHGDDRSAARRAGRRVGMAPVWQRPTDPGLLWSHAGRARGRVRRGLRSRRRRPAVLVPRQPDADRRPADGADPSRPRRRDPRLRRQARPVAAQAPDRCLGDAGRLLPAGVLLHPRWLDVLGRG